MMSDHTALDEITTALFTQLCAEKSNSEHEVLKCPKCSDRLEALELDTDSDGVQTIWWTCRSLADGSCDFPICMPGEVFWVKRTKEQKNAGFVPPPDFKKLPKQFRHLYPNLFPVNNRAPKNDRRPGSLHSTASTTEDDVTSTRSRLSSPARDQTHVTTLCSPEREASPACSILSRRTDATPMSPCSSRDEANSTPPVFEIPEMFLKKTTGVTPGGYVEIDDSSDDDDGPHRPDREGPFTEEVLQEVSPHRLVNKSDKDMIRQMQHKSSVVLKMDREGTLFVPPEDVLLQQENGEDTPTRKEKDTSSPSKRPRREAVAKSSPLAREFNFGYLQCKPTPTRIKPLDTYDSTEVMPSLVPRSELKKMDKLDYDAAKETVAMKKDPMQCMSALFSLRYDNSTSVLRGSAKKPKTAHQAAQETRKIIRHQVETTTRQLYQATEEIRRSRKRQRDGRCESSFSDMSVSVSGSETAFPSPASMDSLGSDLSAPLSGHAPPIQPPTSRVNAMFADSTLNAIVQAKLKKKLVVKKAESHRAAFEKIEAEASSSVQPNVHVPPVHQSEWGAAEASTSWQQTNTVDESWPNFELQDEMWSQSHVISEEGASGSAAAFSDGLALVGEDDLFGEQFHMDDDLSAIFD